MKRGYVKLYRKLLESAVFESAQLLQMWVACLLKASHKEHTMRIGLQNVTLKPGQFICGRHSLAEELGCSPSAARRRLQTLKADKRIDIEANNKYTLVTVRNWRYYQSDDDAPDSNSDRQADNKKTTKRQQKDTNKKGKKGKKTSIELPDWLPKDNWRNWCDYRRARDKKLAEQTMKVNLTKLGKLRAEGQDVAAVIDQTIERGWKGFFPVKDSASEKTADNPYDKIERYKGGK